MNLQEATTWIKDNLNQEIGANTLRKACASGRLRGVRKGEGTMHIRRTEWDVTKEDLTNFIREEYHPRLSRRGRLENGLHIPSTKPVKRDEDNIKEKINSETGLLYRVVEHLYQKPLSIHGDTLEKYDTRIVEAKISSKAKAEVMAQKLEAEARNKNLSEQLHYEVQGYTNIKKVK